MKQTNASASISVAQIAAMQHLNLRYGSHWKRTLTASWESGFFDIQEDADHLVALQREMGTEWLTDYDLPAIDLDADPLATYPARPYGPLHCRAFHGTRVRFDAFRPSSSGALGPGIYLADRQSAAWEYGPLVVEAEVTLANPYVFRPSDDSINAETNPELIEQVLPPRVAMRVADRLHEHGALGYGTEVRDALQAHGFDGVLMLFPEGAPALPGLDTLCVILAFYPAQATVTRVTDLGEWQG
ncbi:hypothetical protein [Paraburkholderia youngii]|uniref:hypothetical protein n=1 Tax=Paraburkholderia youngii TaxID=2782701 RepID=UPI003D203ADA